MAVPFVKLNSSNPTETLAFTAANSGSIVQENTYVQGSGTNSGATLQVNLPSAEGVNANVYVYGQTSSTYITISSVTNLLARGTNGTAANTAILSGLGGYLIKPMPDGQWLLT